MDVSSRYSMPSALRHDMRTKTEFVSKLDKDSRAETELVILVIPDGRPDPTFTMRSVWALAQ
jgi:hypothetical protein